MSDQIVLFGAGAAGRYALRHLREKGITPVRFADNDPAKWDQLIDGIQITSPDRARQEHPEAIWVACGISLPAGRELREQIDRMGVAAMPLWMCLPVPHGYPPFHTILSLLNLSGDLETTLELLNQIWFRISPDYDRQRAPLPSSETYFPDFIVRRKDEHFVDCGAADGDTIEAFAKRWDRFRAITAFEPDPENFAQCKERCRRMEFHPTELYTSAVSDSTGKQCFVPNGDYSSHLSAEGNTAVNCVRIDDLTLACPPTYIKMDIEGAELEALWGARKTLVAHRPVLAICAYHTSDHLWQIPFLIHAIQPDYKLFFRRYAEGAFELVWYAVPPERVKSMDHHAVFVPPVVGAPTPIFRSCEID